MNKRSRASIEQPGPVLKLLGEFLKYGAVGIINTGVHFLVFFGALAAGSSQAAANLLGFAVAVAGSFFLNARFTFKKRPRPGAFLRMAAVMAALSYGAGYAGDLLEAPPVLTFLAYSAASWALGFLVVKFAVFGGKS